MIRKFLLFISFSTLVLSLFSVQKHWNYQETFIDIGKQFKLDVSNENITKEIENSILNSEFDDAVMYLEIAKSNNYAIDYLKYYSMIRKKNTDFNNFKTQVQNFAEGFINGKSENLTGIAGSITADFTIVGDARDLHKEYTNYEQGKPVNELIVALSGAGIGLTALTVGSLGSAAPAKAGTSVIKLAAKTQKISLRFQKHLIKLGRNIFDWRAFTKAVNKGKGFSNLRRAAKLAYHPEAVKPLKNIANSVNSIRKSSSVADTVRMLKYVETTDDLRRLEKVSLKYGTRAKGYFKLLGKTALGTARVLRKTSGLLLSFFSSLISGLFTLLFLFKR